MLSHGSVLVSASTGPMHLAAGLKTPTVSMFCPLTACSPELWGPRGNLADVVLPPEGYCQGRCPGDPHVCEFEGGIEPATVATKVLRMLEAPATGARP
jgi:heptosyltransferase-2